MERTEERKAQLRREEQVLQYLEALEDANWDAALDIAKLAEEDTVLSGMIWDLERDVLAEFEAAIVDKEA